MSFFIGIDVGGTNIVCGLVHEDGTLVRKLKQPTEAGKGSGHVIDNMVRMIGELCDAEGIDMGQLAAIGAGTPGFVDPVRGMSIFAGNLKWRNVPLAEELEKRTGRPAFVDNDVRMYVYGEAISGAAKGYDHVLGITIGTGLAAALVNKGQLYYGGGFIAGEIGHIHMEGLTYPCGCGMTGCLETAASATGIARQARDLISEGRESILRHWFPGERLAEITSSDVSKAYDLGDSAAVEVMNRTGRLLGRGLSYAVTLYSPDIIVIGGGAAMAGERLFAPMREALRSLVHPAYWDRLTIASAQLHDDAGVIGSAAFAKQRLGEERETCH